MKVKLSWHMKIVCCFQTYLSRWTMRLKKNWLKNVMWNTSADTDSEVPAQETLQKLQPSSNCRVKEVNQGRFRQTPEPGLSALHSEASPLWGHLPTASFDIIAPSFGFSVVLLLLLLPVPQETQACTWPGLLLGLKMRSALWVAVLCQASSRWTWGIWLVPYWPCTESTLFEKGYDRLQCEWRQ